MERRDFVVLGLDDVERAVDVAARLGWECRAAPPPVAQALRGEPGCVLLRRPDARLTVVLTPAPVPCRAAGWWKAADSVALDHLCARFSAVLATCTTTEQMVAALVGADAPAFVD